MTPFIDGNPVHGKPARANTIPAFHTRMADRLKPGAEFNPPDAPYVWADERRGDVYVFAVASLNSCTLVGKVRIYKKRRDAATDTRIPGSDDKINAYIEEARLMLRK